MLGIPVHIIVIIIFAILVVLAYMRRNRWILYGGYGSGYHLQLSIFFFIILVIGNKWLTKYIYGSIVLISMLGLLKVLGLRCFFATSWLTCLTWYFLERRIGRLIMKKRLIVLKQWFNKFKKLILTVAIVKYSITLVVIVILYFISRN